MIQSKCAELWFLIGVVMCGVAGNSAGYFEKNNENIFVVRAGDEIIGNGGSHHLNDGRFIFTTMRC
jgi:hypothetical protein